MSNRTLVLSEGRRPADSPTRSLAAARSRRRYVVFIFMRQLALSTVLVLTGVLSAVPVHAQAPAPGGGVDPVIEATVFAVPRSSTHASVGGGVAYFWTPRIGVEGEVTLGDAIRTGAASLIYALPSAWRLTPFVSAGMGFEKQDFVDLSTIHITRRSPTRLATSLGGGLTIRVTGRMAIRSDLRWTNQRWRVGNGVSVRF